MNSANLTNFLKALDAVKNDFTCGVCSNLCKNPVTLSKCFHIICAEHFDELKTCPNCKIPLEGCKTISDDKLEKSVDSTRKLDKMFENYRAKDATVNDAIPGTKRKKTKQKVVKTNSNTEEKDLSDTRNTVPNKSLSTRADNRNETIVSNLSQSKLSKGLERRNNKGETSLHVNCRLGKMDKVEECLKEGANTNTKDNAGWTPLHEAVQNGRLDLVTLLLQYNTLIDVPGQSNETPLHEAVRFNHIEIAEVLVKHGADINARNIKGETPLQLAKEEMKQTLINASENILQTQGVNISHISKIHTELDADDMRVYCISSFRTIQNKLKTVVKHHSNVYIEPKFSKKVTHLIVDADDGICDSSLDVLQAIVCGMWILSSNWVVKCSNAKLEPFDEYEIKGVGTSSNNGPKNSRYNKYKQLPGIFNGCHFYLHNFNTKYDITKTLSLTKAILNKLITDAGGVVLRRVPNPESIPESEKLIPYHAKKSGKLTNCSHYIIFKDMYEPMYNMQHLKALPIGWFIECLEKYELCEPW